MTDKQPEALRLAKILEEGWTNTYGRQAAAELRRLHEVNAELVEVLREIMSWEENEEMVWAERAKAALRKAQGENNE